VGFCNKCENKLDDGAIFCEKCGRFVELEPELLINKTQVKNSEMILSVLIMASISVVLAWFGVKGLMTYREQISNKQNFASYEVADSIFVGDMSCGFEGATYLVEQDDFRLYLLAHPTYGGGELSISDYTYSFPISSALYYGKAFVSISDRFYDEQGNEVQDGAELTFYENGNVKVDWGIFCWRGNKYTYTTLMEDEFESDLVIRTSEYVRYEGALDKLDSFEIQDTPSSNIFRDIDNGKLKSVEFYGYDEEEDLCLTLTRDFIDKNTYIRFELNDLYLSFYTDEQVSYNEEKVYFIDSYSGNELSYKYKRNGTKQYNLNGNGGYYELKFTVSEEDIKVECISHDTREEISYSVVIAEEYVQRRTIIEN